MMVNPAMGGCIHMIYRMLIPTIFAGLLFAQPVLGINVVDFGALANAKTDCTQAFQRALDKAGKTGETVYAPAGVYFFSGHIRVPSGVTLVGSWQGPPGRRTGTVLQVVEGHGDEAGTPFITLEGGAGVKGIVIEYPKQTADSDKPVPYPWTIRGLAEDCRVIDVLFYRAYQGIDFGTYPCSRPYIDGVYGSVLRRGIYLDGCVDVGRISNVHFTTFGFTYQGPMDKWKLANCEAFLIGKADWVWMHNCFALGVKIGFRFIRGMGGNGKRAGPPNYVQISNCGIDESDTPIIVEECSGLSFSQCVFKGKASRIEETNTQPVRFVQCNFSPVPGTRSLVEAAGKGRVSFTDCTFEFWDTLGDRSPALLADCTSFSVQGSEFGTDNKPSFILGDGSLKTQIRITSRVQSGLVIGNRLRYGKSIINESKGDVVISGNVTDDFDALTREPN